MRTATALIPAEMALSYDDFHRVLRARVHELGMSNTTIDALAGWTDGMVGKILGAARMKTLGPFTLPALLEVLGLRLLVAEGPT
jgi:hypothetical protein